MRKIFTLLMTFVMFPLVAWGQDGITGYWEDKINEAVAETDYQVIGSTYNIFKFRKLIDNLLLGI